MRKLFLSVSLIALIASSANAGPFRRTVKPDPATQVPALLESLKNDKDDRARARAAAALDEFDAKAFPDILPALAQALAVDPSSSVREEAASAIGKIRPITPQAGFALEQSLANEKTITVKLAVRKALLQYRILGYFGGIKAEFASQSSEPPVAISGAVKGIASGTVLRPTPSPAPFSPTVVPAAPAPANVAGPTRVQSTEPPIAPLPVPPSPVIAVPDAVPSSPASTSKSAPVIVIPSPSREPSVVVPPGSTQKPDGPALPPK